MFVMKKLSNMTDSSKDRDWRKDLSKRVMGPMGGSIPVVLEKVRCPLDSALSWGVFQMGSV
jgi:hypothetical protein